MTERLGNDTTEAMFKYIDNKTERSVEATIKTLATKDDVNNLRIDLGSDIANLRKEVLGDVSTLRRELLGDIGALRKEMLGDNVNLRKDFDVSIIKLHKEIAESRAENIKWMFIFWVGQVGAMLAVILLFVKK